MGISRACHVMNISRSSFSYQSIKDDGFLYGKLMELSEQHPKEGFWKSYFRIRNQGEKVNHKRLHRIYKQAGLPMRRKGKKRKIQRVKQPLIIPETFTKGWSMDFMSDALENGRKIRTFNIIDDYNREVLHIEVDYSIKSSRVTWILRRLVNRYGKPESIRMDNGPEFIAKLIQTWSEVNHIAFTYIQPGKPTQNSLIERFNKSYREGVLDAYLFADLNEVREITHHWVEDYNHDRPHDALAGMSPVKYRISNENKKDMIQRKINFKLCPN